MMALSTIRKDTGSIKGEESMIKMYVTSIGDKLKFECYDPWVNKKPKQKVEVIYIFTSKEAKQHYWNFFQKFPENWRFEK